MTEVRADPDQTNKPRIIAKNKISGSSADPKVIHNNTKKNIIRLIRNET